MHRCAPPHWLLGALAACTFAATAAASSPDQGDGERPPLSDRIGVTGLELEEARTFFSRFQSAIRNEDVDAVVAMIEFPITAEVHGKRRRIPSPRLFRKHYSEIMCPAVTTVILAQEFEALFANYQGLMIGRGEVWFGGVCNDPECVQYRVRVYTLNGPFMKTCDDAG